MSRTVPLLLQLSGADPRPIVRQIGDGIRRAIARYFGLSSLRSLTEVNSAATYSTG